MEYFIYRWNSYNFHVACVKCGNRIIFQTSKGKPECDDCGHVAKFSWVDALKFVEVEDLKKGKGGNKKIMGQMDANVSAEPVNSISCYHCKSDIKTEPDTSLENFECPHCKKHLEFEQMEGIPDMVLYAHKNSEKPTGPATMIAVKCVSCGAPLEADPTKTNFHCKFCSTENILPPSMRYKIVVDDIFIGAKKQRFPKHLAFGKNQEAVRLTLKENGLKEFTEEELNTILLNNKHNNTIYNLLVHEKGYGPPDQVLQEIFNTTTNQQLVQVTGNRLNKTAEEKDARIIQVNPNYVKHKENLKKQEKPATPKSKWIPVMIVGAVVLVILFIVFQLFTSPG